ncbi:unnamed protein product [Symbiodinium necroappetens]|uniref:Uncharacterized protein n=1 Tax=Symbiodinium necroappetens TaxID=1628268 RepID=A0A812M931_9DINO|nr:unnamed protein product [Symbiodinium necroappetens]
MLPRARISNRLRKWCQTWPQLVPSLPPWPRRSYRLLLSPLRSPPIRQRPELLQRLAANCIFSGRQSLPVAGCCWQMPRKRSHWWQMPPRQSHRSLRRQWWATSSRRSRRRRLWRLHSDLVGRHPQQPRSRQRARTPRLRMNATACSLLKCFRSKEGRESISQKDIRLEDSDLWR